VARVPVGKEVSDAFLPGPPKAEARLSIRDACLTMALVEYERRGNTRGKDRNNQFERWWNAARPFGSDGDTGCLLSSGRAACA